MRKQMLVVAAGIVLMLALVTVAVAADPFVGTWKLNVAKSKAGDPSMMPKSEVVKIVAKGDDIKTTFDGVDISGKAYHSEWSGKWDGKDYPAKGDPDVDMSAIKKADANTLVAVDKKAGKEIMTWTVTLSKDGKSMTAVGKAKNAKGQPVPMEIVYEKQ